MDKETKGTYTVTVTAADSLSESSTITVTIKVTNVDEMPDLEGEVPEEYAENGTGVVARFRADGPGGRVDRTWSLAGNNECRRLLYRERRAALQETPPTMKTLATSNICTQLRFRHPTVAQTRLATEDVTIEITNVDEPGTVTLSTLQPQVDVVIMATLDDPDSEIYGDYHLAVVPGQHPHQWALTIGEGMDNSE